MAATARPMLMRTLLRALAVDAAGLTSEGGHRPNRPQRVAELRGLSHAGHRAPRATRRQWRNATVRRIGARSARQCETCGRWVVVSIACLATHDEATSDVPPRIPHEGHPRARLGSEGSRQFETGSISGRSGRLLARKALVSKHAVLVSGSAATARGPCGSRHRAHVFGATSGLQDSLPTKAGKAAAEHALWICVRV